MAHRDVPGGVRIRTDDGNEWRYDAIQAAADYYDWNRSDAVAYACEDMTGAVEFVRAVLGARISQSLSGATSPTSPHGSFAASTSTSSTM
ncbi:DUF7692 domain-containing protein [Halorubellus litoreus]|uniref:DUF7692 domain-containing protein n=1 Tax=Halorubellus litoreus TaxID=755308 RepID=A0ABD5VLX4_9EURY